MSEASNGSDDGGSPEWEVIACPSHHASADISQEQETFSLITDGGGSLETNYFSVLPDSTVDTSQQSGGEEIEPIRPAEESLSVMETPEEDAPCVSPETDWIEPCSPYRSYALSTEEDEESLSRKSSSPPMSDELKGEVDLQTPGVGCQANLSRELCTSSIPRFLGGSNIPGNGTGDTSFRLHRSYLVEEVELLEAGLACVPSQGESILDHREAVAGELPFVDRITDAWWMKQLAVWQGEGGPANTLWSIAVAAAVVGLLILGQRWQRLRWQNQKFRLELSTKEKKIGQLMYQLLQMKECLSCSRRIPVIRAQPTFQSFDKF